MNTWMIALFSILEYVPLTLLSLVLFRQRIKPYLKEIAVISLLAGVLGVYAGPLAYVAGIFALFYLSLKFKPVTALLAAFSGYTLAVVIRTSVFLLNDSTAIVSIHSTDGSAGENMLDVILLVFLIIFAKFVVVSAMARLRWGFTFLAHYSKVPFTKDNLGFYGFMAIVMMGVLFREQFPVALLDSGMPFHMSSMAVGLFVYTTLRRELGYE